MANRGEYRISRNARGTRIRSNIADVYGVICGELASPSSGLNSAISGKENSLIKLGQLFPAPRYYPSGSPFVLHRRRLSPSRFVCPSIRIVRFHPCLRPPSPSSPGHIRGWLSEWRAGWRDAARIATVTRLDSFSSRI